MPRSGRCGRAAFFGEEKPALRETGTTTMETETEPAWNCSKTTSSEPANPRGLRKRTPAGDEEATVSQPGLPQSAARGHSAQWNGAMRETGTTTMETETLKTRVIAREPHRAPRFFLRLGNWETVRSPSICFIPNGLRPWWKTGKPSFPVPKRSSAVCQSNTTVLFP